MTPGDFDESTPTAGENSQPTSNSTQTRSTDAPAPQGALTHEPVAGFSRVLDNGHGPFWSDFETWSGDVGEMVEHKNTDGRPRFVLGMDTHVRASEYVAAVIIPRADYDKLRDTAARLAAAEADAQRYRAVRYVLCERYGFRVSDSDVKVTPDRGVSLTWDAFDNSVDSFVSVAQQNMRNMADSAAYEARTRPAPATGGA